MYDKIEGESTGLGNLASKIPGFSGYIERSRRREADQILRQTIAARLEETRLQLGNIHHELSRDIARAIDFAEPLGRTDADRVPQPQQPLCFDSIKSSGVGSGRFLSPIARMRILHGKYR